MSILTGKLLTETIEDVNFLIEEDVETKKKSYCIEGLWIMTEAPNRNNRIYKFGHMSKVVEAYNRDYVTQNRAWGELGHPDNPSINLDRVSHMITTLRPEGTNFYGKAKILDTPTGNIVKGLLDGGGKLGVSTRGVGSLKPQNGYHMVQDDFQMSTAGDIVANPSAQIAFVNAIVENKEWIFENGNWHEVQLDRAKRKIKFTSKREIETVAMKLFEDYISKL
jgi:hypothetical protein